MRFWRKKGEEEEEEEEEQEEQEEEGLLCVGISIKFPIFSPSHSCTLSFRFLHKYNLPRKRTAHTRR